MLELVKLLRDFSLYLSTVSCPVDLVYSFHKELHSLRLRSPQSSGVNRALYFFPVTFASSFFIGRVTLLVFFFFYRGLHQVPQQEETQQTKFEWKLLQLGFLNKKSANFVYKLSAINKDDPV